MPDHARWLVTIHYLTDADIAVNGSGLMCRPCRKARIAERRALSAARHE
jgi:hypothetical protein